MSDLSSFRPMARLVLAAGLAASAGCGDQTETPISALDRAQANIELQQSIDAVQKAGWKLGTVTASDVERFQAPASAAADTPAAGGPSTWTRVRFPIFLPAVVDRPEVRADLIVAWPDQGADVFAVAARDEAAAKPLLDALPASANPGASSGAPAAEADGVIETEVGALACGGGIGDSCSSAVRCCYGLACTAYSYYSTCSCGTVYTASYPERATVSVACFNLWDNPIGAAKIQRYRRGCAANNAWSLNVNACGRSVSTPGFQTSTWTQLICLFTPGPIC